MTIIDNTFSDIRIGPASTFQNLTVFPLIGASDTEPSYDTLDAALLHGTLRITEVTESGRVPEIKVLNGGGRPVLIIDGEELLGAKQNRTVNLSILIPAHADVVVPVTCVEAGRWHSRSVHFEASSRTHFAEGRAAKSRQVSESLLTHGVPTADQSQVWDAIAMKSARFKASSRTGAMADIFEATGASVDDYLRGVPVSAGQVGALFLIDSQCKGLDMFDTSQTLRSLLPKVLRGYALDAIDSRLGTSSDHNDLSPVNGGPDAAISHANAFLESVMACDRRSFLPIGVGEAWRLMGHGVSGGALTYKNRVVHLSAFVA